MSDARDWPDLLGGAALALTGAGVAAVAALRLDVGTLRQMGPGFLPLVLGAVLTVLGAAIALGARGRVAPPLTIHWREAACVIGGILLFAAGLPRLGLMPSTALLVLVASVPAPRAGLGWRLVLAAAVTLLTWAVFSAGLRIGLPLWPRLP